jgi:hypothetical protein
LLHRSFDLYCSHCTTFYIRHYHTNTSITFYQALCNCVSFHDLPEVLK